MRQERIYRLIDNVTRLAQDIHEIAKEGQEITEELKGTCQDVCSRVLEKIPEIVDDRVKEKIVTGTEEVLNDLSVFLDNYFREIVQDLLVPPKKVEKVD